MSLIPARCIDFSDNRKECIAYENGKTYKLNNLSKLIIKKVRVDKCLIQNIGEKRCDYLIDITELKSVYFIELKGSKLNHALKQINTTIEYLKPEFKNYKMEARIVGSKDVPHFKNIPDYKKLAKLILPTNGSIERGTNNFYTESV